ncbi:MAG: fibronectin type III domain-containing protein [Gammaproteobacteria bacterium]
MKSSKLIYAIALCAGMMGLGGANAEAATARAVTLKWASNPGQVSGYEVYYRKAPQMRRLRQLPVSYTMNLAAPSARYNVLRDLGALPGQTVCFRVKAYNNVAKSAFSPAVCTKV